MATTKGERVVVPPGNIQAEPRFVARLIEQAFVYLGKQFLNLTGAYDCV